MSTESSNPLPDVLASTSHPPPPKPKPSPPIADNVVRPFTSQGSTFTSPFRPLAYAPPHSDRPSTAHNSPVDPSNSKFGPYISASARTSYTRVDVDSISAPEYPPLPPVLTASTVQDVPPLAAAPAADSTTLPVTTTITPTTPMPDASTNGAQTLATEAPIPQTPQVSLTFLLISGLRKTQSFDPETTVGRVKELVWSAWPARDADWQDERPPAPSYLRILYLGKILQDDDTLLRVGFATSLPSASGASPAIVHLSIRPYALPSDDPALSKKKRLSVAVGRRLSTLSVGVGGGGRDVDDGETRRAGCCTGCTIC